MNQPYPLTVLVEEKMQPTDSNAHHSYVYTEEK